MSADLEKITVAILKDKQITFYSIDEKKVQNSIQKILNDIFEIIDTVAVLQKTTSRLTSDTKGVLLIPTIDFNSEHFPHFEFFRQDVHPLYFLPDYV